MANKKNKNKNKRRNPFQVNKKITSKEEVVPTEKAVKKPTPAPDKKPEPVVEPEKVVAKVDEPIQQKTVSVVETKNIADTTPVEETPAPVENFLDKRK